MRPAIPGEPLSPAFGEALAIGEDWAHRAALMGGAASDHGVERCFEKDDQGVAERGEGVASRTPFERAASQRQDKGLAGAGGEGFADDFGLQIAEGGLTAAAKMSAMVMAARASTRTSESRKSQPRRSASRAPTVVLPAPIKPVRTIRVG
jgi:hypothetical protein